MDGAVCVDCDATQSMIVNLAGGSRYKVLVIGDAFNGNSVRGIGAVPVKALTQACVSPVCLFSMVTVSLLSPRWCPTMQAKEGHVITSSEMFTSQFCAICQQALLRREKSRLQFCCNHGFVARDLVC